LLTVLPLSLEHTLSTPNVGVIITHSIVTITVTITVTPLNTTTTFLHP
jgi:hypothetical protein